MSKCIECGLCREVCPIFKILRRESVSPRGYVIMQKKEVYDKIFYLCTLCGNCEKVCPYDAKLGFLEFREKCVDEGVTTNSNTKVIENLKKTGNPYGFED